MASILSLISRGVNPSEAIRLREVVYSYAREETGKRTQGRISKDEADAKAAKAKHSRGSLYNGHSRASAHSSSEAYTSGDSASHKVAAEHHDRAAEAADHAKELHEAKTTACDDYACASKYHKAQAAAHRAAADHAERGNMDSHISRSHYDY